MNLKPELSPSILQPICRRARRYGHERIDPIIISADEKLSHNEEQADWSHFGFHQAFK